MLLSSIPTLSKFDKDGANLLDTFVESFLGPEDSSIGLHGLLHVQDGSWQSAVGR